MNHPLTTTLSSPWHQFLTQEQKWRKTSKKQIIEDGLALYKKEKLQREIADGLLERKQEYRDVAGDFSAVQSTSLQE